MKSPEDEFWRHKRLDELSDAQWESLCDGCGRCCLYKFEEIDSGKILYTNVVCKFLEPEQCRCQVYTQRLKHVADCLDIRGASPETLRALPGTCAYRLLSEGKPLPEWHPLISGNRQSVFAAGVAVRGWSVSEEFIHPDALSDHIIELEDE